MASEFDRSDDLLREIGDDAEGYRELSDDELDDLLDEDVGDNNDPIEDQLWDDEDEDEDEDEYDDCIECGAECDRFGCVKGCNDE